MMITGIAVRWYGRNPDLTPNYDDEHHGTLTGDSPEEIMGLIRVWKNKQDLSKVTPIEIVGIF